LKRFVSALAIFASGLLTGGGFIAFTSAMAEPLALADPGPPPLDLSDYDYKPPEGDVAVAGCPIDTLLKMPRPELNIHNQTNVAGDYVVSGVVERHGSSIALGDFTGIRRNVLPKEKVRITAASTAAVPHGTQVTCRITEVRRSAAANS